MLIQQGIQRFLVEPAFGKPILVKDLAEPLRIYLSNAFVMMNILPTVMEACPPAGTLARPWPRLRKPELTRHATPCGDNLARI